VKKQALILSGGGSFGAFEVGAIDYLIQKADFKFDIFLGTSVGALNAGFLGQAHNNDELKDNAAKLTEFWMSINGYQDIFNRSIIGDSVLVFRDYLYEPVGLKKIIKQNINFDKLCGNPAKNVKIAVVELETGKIVLADNQSPEYWEDYPNYILASTSMPLYFPGVMINSRRCYDGGLRDITPIGKVFDERPDEIVIVTTYPVNEDFSPRFREEHPVGSLKVLLRTIDIFANEIGANDLKVANFIYEQLEYFPGQGDVAIHFITPEDPLPGNDSLDFDPKRIRDNFKKGYEAAQKPRTLIYRSELQPGKLSG
jgi:NTE family protein